MRLVRSVLSRLRRLHPFTWCMVLLTIGAMLLITMAGQYVDPVRQDVVTPWHEQCKELYLATHDRHLMRDSNDRYVPLTVRVFEHGWPTPYLARAVASNYGRPGRELSMPKIQFASPFRAWGGSTNLPISWSNYDNWPLSADDWIFRPGAFLLDALLALAVIVGVGGASEWWARRRVGFLRFRLSDLLAALTIGCVLLGWHQHHARIQRLERREATSIIAPAFTTHAGEMTFGNRYQGPDWLRRLTGSEYLLPFLHHVEYASIKPGDRWRDCFETLPQLPYLEEVHLRGPLPLEAWSDLQRCRKLERLSLQLSHSARPEADIAGAARIIGIADLERLKTLRLRELKLSGDSILAQDLEQLAGLTTLRRLELFNASVTLPEIETIRWRHPQLKLTATWHYDQFVWPTPPKDHDLAVAKVKGRRQEARAANKGHSPDGALRPFACAAAGPAR